MMFEGEPPNLVGKYSGTLLVVGGGRCVFKDIAKYTGDSGTGTFTGLRRWQESGSHDVMAVNDIGQWLTCKIEHWCSLHADHLMNWMTLRRHHGLNCDAIQTHGHKEKPGIDNPWPMVPNMGGLSGLYAAMLGVLLGYEKVVLAGIPCDGTGRFYDPPDSGGMHGERSIITAWEENMNCYPEMKEYVTSLSGYTREVLGGPDGIGR